MEKGAFMEQNRIYFCIDMKCFYASVECAERGLNPFTTNLVVADKERGRNALCLAISPALKARGVKNRCRISDIPTSFDYIVAKPRMKLYVEYAADIYDVYLDYISHDDIHVYSIDEVFIDITPYLRTYKMAARELTMKVITEVLNATGITATAGIGTNLYLSKIAMDIVAKRMKADKNGVRIAQLDEASYRRILWEHRPLTDFWRVGRGYEKRLNANGMYTMGDIALRSLENEDSLYRLFGVNAELLIDHAWGWESCTMKNIKAYVPTSSSLSTGQVLHCPYTATDGALIVREMCDLLVLDMVRQGIATSQITLTIGYEAISKGELAGFDGEVGVDFYGRVVPKYAHGSINFLDFTSSSAEIINNTLHLYDKIVDKRLLVRRINICASNIKNESERGKVASFEQLDMFTDYDRREMEREKKEQAYFKEKQSQKAIIEIKKKYGKNSILKGMNFLEGATTIDRNLQIGGHKA